MVDAHPKSVVDALDPPPSERATFVDHVEIKERWTNSLKCERSNTHHSPTKRRPRSINTEAFSSSVRGDHGATRSDVVPMALRLIGSITTRYEKAACHDLCWITRRLWVSTQPRGRCVSGRARCSAL
jgi:hypothetical protein